ncbi:GldG family protein [Gorillibacterium sp. sgz5001074]|uniref:GldG family protein n=1 Tax=Gorillibacterium sp. sgz5001074 TaxID=3446695 RepID=UPI003F67CD48
MKNWIKGTNAAVLSLAAVGIFILLTIFLHSMKGVQWDLTANKKFTLSDKTVSTVKSLDKEVHAIAFTQEGQSVVSRQIKDLLDEYHKLNDKFTWEEVDPKKKPAIAQKYQIDAYGTIVFEGNGKTKSVSSSELFGYGSDQTTYTYDGESKFTQAILDLISGQKHVAYVVTGHNELPMTNASEFKRGLENEGVEWKDLNLFKDGAIPQDAETLVILSPQKDLSEQEAKLITDYLADKGKLYMTVDLAKDMDKWTHWTKVLDAVGVKSQNALVVESSKTLSSDPLTIVPQYGYHDITKKLEQQQVIVAMPGVMSLTAQTDKTGFTASSLLRTGDQGYGKTNLAPFTSNTRLTQEVIKKTDADLKGPLDLAYAVTKDDKPKAVVIGNGLFLRDDWIAEQSNRDFALNSVNWLSGQKELVTIRPREEKAPQQVYIALSKQKLIYWGTILVFPLCFLVLGGFVWWRRRKG